jgi:hypothetical protein
MPCQRFSAACCFPEFLHAQAGICFRCIGERNEEFIKFEVQIITVFTVSTQVDKNLKAAAGVHFIVL